MHAKKVHLNEFGKIFFNSSWLVFLLDSETECFNRYLNLQKDAFVFCSGCLEFKKGSCKTTWVFLISIQYTFFMVIFCILSVHKNSKVNFGCITSLYLHPQLLSELLIWSFALLARVFDGKLDTAISAAPKCKV